MAKYGIPISLPPGGTTERAGWGRKDYLPCALRDVERSARHVRCDQRDSRPWLSNCVFVQRRDRGRSRGIFMRVGGEERKRKNFKVSCCTGTLIDLSGMDLLYYQRDSIRDKSISVPEAFRY